MASKYPSDISIKCCTRAQVQDYTAATQAYMSLRAQKDFQTPEDYCTDRDEQARFTLVMKVADS